MLTYAKAVRANEGFQVYIVLPLMPAFESAQLFESAAYANACAAAYATGVHSAAAYASLRVRATV
jgi:hypothetical protein